MGISRRGESAIVKRIKLLAKPYKHSFFMEKTINIVYIPINIDYIFTNIDCIPRNLDYIYRISCCFYKFVWLVG